MELKNMKDPTENEPAKTVRVSSAYTRVVGNKTLNVINTKQTPGLPKKAYNKKWVVIQQNGNRMKVVGNSDKKYPAIDILLAAEKQLKAEAAKAEADNQSWNWWKLKTEKNRSKKINKEVMQKNKIKNPGRDSQPLPPGGSGTSIPTWYRSHNYRSRSTYICDGRGSFGGTVLSTCLTSVFNTRTVIIIYVVTEGSTKTL